METGTGLPNGIQSIALSFSGGGFRAAAFTLGCVSYLNRLPYEGKPLLEKVKFISSASGGTITSLVLTYMQRQGSSFEEIYHFLLEQMSGTRLLDKVFDILNDDAQWRQRPEKSRNLINAFSIAYDKYLFKEARFDAMLKPSLGAQDFFIEEISVNTTEFNNGLNFRFGNRGTIGNSFLRFRKEGLPAAGMIRLGDILACSSCFPAGFEPVMFPQDFTWKSGDGELDSGTLFKAISCDSHYNGVDVHQDIMDANQPERDDRLTKPFGIMDGGIDDNQGIYSFLLADERKAGHYDLYLPCDVSSNYLENPFEYPAPVNDPILENTPAGLLRKIKGGVVIYAMVAGLALAAAAVLLGMKTLPQVGFFLLGCSMLAILLPAITYFVLRKKLTRIMYRLFPPAPVSEPKGTWSIVLAKYKDRLLDRPLSQLLLFIFARMSSVLLLADTVYLKRIRQLSYSGLYAQKANGVYKDLIEKNNELVPPGKVGPGRLWNDHIGSTTVYLLSEKNHDVLVRELKGEPWDYETAVAEGTGMLLKEFLLPSAKLMKIVNVAADMDTTLWFDENHQDRDALRSLIVAGQATMCFTMLRIALRFDNNTEAWRSMRSMLTADWALFGKTPDHLYDSYAQASATAG